MGHQTVKSSLHDDHQVRDRTVHEEALLRVQIATAGGLKNKAHELLLEARARFPDCARVAYLLGVSLLDRGNMTGLDHLKFSMAQDEAMTGTACAQAVTFLAALGEVEAATGFQNKLNAWERLSGGV